MRDLEFFEIPLGDIKLERLDICNKNHIKATRGLRDLKARVMCYDVKGFLRKGKHNLDINGNPFLVKDNNSSCYVGYMYISNGYPGNVRVLSYIVNKKLRNRGYGKMMLTSVSDFLFECGLADKVELYIRKGNPASKRVALNCKFNYSNSGSSEHVEKFTRKK